MKEMEQKFYICRHCGNIVAMVQESGVPIVCCGENMELLIPGTTDGAAEKHVPVVRQEGNKVYVHIGEADHPMIPEHYIQWVSLHTKYGNQRKPLHPGDVPEVCFALCDGDEVYYAYEYCNIHGLWKRTVKAD